MKVAKSLDFEVKSDYVLTIMASDGGDLPKATTTTLTINLLDLSDSEPTCVETSISVSVPETHVSGEQV